MSFAVVTVASGGLPVVELAAGKLGLPVTEATNGRGIAVTKVVGGPGLPVVFDTIGTGGGGTPSYSNPGGMGNRTATITVTTNVVAGGGVASMLLNGTYGNEYYWNAGQSSRTMTFDFGVGASKIINEFKWYQNNPADHGSWVFGGSNNDSSYTEFPETFTLGGAGSPYVTTIPVTNTTGYRYYRLRQTSGVTSLSPYLTEIEFKIA